MKVNRAPALRRLRKDYYKLKTKHRVQAHKKVKLLPLAWLQLRQTQSGEQSSRTLDEN